MILLAPFLQAPSTISIDLMKPSVQVSSNLYGLMTEEINHCYDGGLYGELIRNRAFLDDRQRPVYWSAVGPDSSITLEQAGPTPARPMSLRVQGRVANEGYWGIPVRANTKYNLSVWAKNDGNSPITASIESNDGATVYARATLSGADGSWRKLVATLKTDARVKETTGARLVFSAAQGMPYSLSQVSLFPPTFKNRANGNRIDLTERMIEMRPKFLRFPGGNYLEGNTLNDYFPWKSSLGPIEGRPGHQCPWGYRSTDGMGLLEFLLWCDEIKAKPLLAVYAGYALNGSVVKAGPALEPYVQDALDEIEYVIGDRNTKWGAQRIKDGHPKPFALECVEVGNEDGFDKSGSYEGRFVQFYDAIKAKYPKLKVISTTGGKDWLGVKFPINQRKPDLVDEHYYSESWDMMAMATKYDDYDRRGPKVFVGEWAAHDTVAPWAGGRNYGPTPNMKCAIADAAFLTGLERNSDIVAMSCYAPLFVNVNPGGRQWSLNLVGFDGLKSFGSPSYYVQTMFGQNLGDRTVSTLVSGVPQQVSKGRKLPCIFASTTRDTQSGNLYIKIVNAMPTAESVRLDISGAQLDGGGTMTVLAGELTAMNSIAEPTKLAPKTSNLSGLGNSFVQTFPGNSVTVIKLWGAN